MNDWYATFAVLGVFYLCILGYGIVHSRWMTYHRSEQKPRTMNGVHQRRLARKHFKVLRGGKR